MAGTTVESSVSDQEDLADLPPEDLEPPPDNGDAAIEARAREMGWKPLAEYRGPPGRWQPAKNFIERGENELPIVRDRNRRLEERVGRLEGEISGLRSTASEQLQIIKDLRDMGARANQAGYERAMAEIKSKQRQAVAAGDTPAYDQLVEQAEALASSRPAAAPVTPEPQKPATEQPPRPPVTAAVQTFYAQNPWFFSEKLLADTMIHFHQKLLRERKLTQDFLNANPEVDREVLEEAKQRVIDKYPEEFSEYSDMPQPRPAPLPASRRRAAPVAPPTPANERQQPPGVVSTTINSIADPAERAQVRDAFNRLKRQLPETTEADYMALYIDPHADVLALQQQKPRTAPNGR
jgi:hypothetical protein